MKNISLTALLSLMLFITAGCSVHERITPDPGPIPESYLEQEKKAIAILIGGKWWEKIGDAKLNSLMEEALVNNLDLEQAFARLDQLEAVYRIVDSQRWPFLNV